MSQKADAELRKAHEEALKLMTTTIHGIKAGQWDNQTPCDEWTVRDLVNHITAENLWGEPLLDGKTIEQVGDQYEGDVLGNDPVAAWDQAAKNCGTAFANVRDLNQEVHVSWGEISAFDYLQQMTSDLVIHSWDIGRGSGQDVKMPKGLAEMATSIVKPLVDSGFASSVFHDPLKVAADADAQTKLIALSGRDPNWMP